MLRGGLPPPRVGDAGDSGEFPSGRRADEPILRFVSTIDIVSGTTWRQYARCLGVDPEVFYPASDEGAEPAKAICRVCPVREACLEHAITAREKQGVWGGLTERERRRLIRQRRKSA